MISIDFDLFKRFMQSYSLRELADVLGVSPQAVSKISGGEKLSPSATISGASPNSFTRRINHD